MRILRTLNRAPTAPRPIAIQPKLLSVPGSIMPRAGVEPARVSPLAPKASASARFRHRGVNPA